MLVQPWAEQLARFDAKPLAEDYVGAPIRTIRYFSEGIATSHFTPSRARLTGNAPVAGAPYVVIMGNSFVEALQVPDLDTMGSVVERLSRDDGHPVNVRQYGWSGASPPKYALEAGSVERLWHPRMVVVVVHRDDFGPAALRTHWSLAAINDGVISCSLVPAETSSLQARIAQGVSHIGILNFAMRRFVLDLLPGIESLFQRALPNVPNLPIISDEEITHELLQSLKQAYGPKLFVIYAAEPDLKNPELGNVEATMLRNCYELGIRCDSTGDAARKAILQGTGFLNGFLNTAPAEGHYNSEGHRIVGNVIWNEYTRRQLAGQN